MLQDFLSPINASRFEPENGYNTSQLGAKIICHQNSFPDLANAQLAIIGVLEDRKAIQNEGCANGVEQIRAFLYQLNEGDFQSKIVDLGNILPGESLRDTHYALKVVTESLLKKSIIPIIIGGGNDLCYAQYWAYENLDKKVDLLSFDSHFDLDATVDEHQIPNSQSYLNSIILHEPNFLFNFSNIGYQTYYANQESIQLMDKMYFDIHRLGEFRNKIQESEPIIRNADLISVDISAVKMADAPGNANAHPNGFYGEEMCQMMRYAGMSDKCSSIGFYEFNPKYDHRNQTAELIAQMIWCFVEGFYARKDDHPSSSKNDYIKYRATFKDVQHEVIFLKSKKTDRWWMQIPYPNLISKNERYLMVPCSYEDYVQATNGEVPNRWWKNYQKLIV